MIQVKTFRNEYDLNEWLKEYQNDYIIKDIKFGYCGTSSWTHEKFMVIYETISTMPEGIPFQWMDAVNGGLQIGGI